MRSLVAAFVTLSVCDAFAQTPDLEMLSEPRLQDGLPYRLFRPAAVDPATKYPLVIYLHGADRKSVV